MLYSGTLQLFYLFAPIPDLVPVGLIPANTKITGKYNLNTIVKASGIKRHFSAKGVPRYRYALMIHSRICSKNVDHKGCVGNKLSDTTIEEKPNNDDVLVATTAVASTAAIGVSAWLIATKLLQKKKGDEEGPSDIVF